MIAAGRKPSDVARFVLEERGERPGVTFNTVKKYVQVYRRFFISPLEILKANVDNRTEGVPSIVDRKLNGLLGKIEEIETLEKALKAQSERIDDQVKKEKELGLPLPGIDRALVVFKDMVKTLVELKMELGYPGYQRVSQKVDLTGHVNVARIQQLSPEDRHEILEIGKTISQLMEKAWAKKSFQSPPEQLLPQ